ncbi:MAG: hypothetical protein SP1CHLAM54_00320 [Chlamydiia bacterium]|nr:hypothetical protein [Chlamydiia bacterium]MCH9614954.1 hypothetical protein [Chlamydiia bacterium]MCH9629996.1 hypothetical protein [Chlamydiia bacterium]
MSHFLTVLEINYAARMEVLQRANQATTSAAAGTPLDAFLSDLCTRYFISTSLKATRQTYTAISEGLQGRLVRLDNLDARDDVFIGTVQKLVALMLHDLRPGPGTAPALASAPPPPPLSMVVAAPPPPPKTAASESKKRGRASLGINRLTDNPTWVELWIESGLKGRGDGKNCWNSLQAAGATWLKQKNLDKYLQAMKYILKTGHQNHGLIDCHWREVARAVDMVRAGTVTLATPLPDELRAIPGHPRVVALPAPAAAAQAIPVPMPLAIQRPATRPPLAALRPPPLSLADAAIGEITPHLDVTEKGDSDSAGEKRQRVRK